MSNYTQKRTEQIQVEREDEYWRCDSCRKEVVQADGGSLTSFYTGDPYGKVPDGWSEFTKDFDGNNPDDLHFCEQCTGHAFMLLRNLRRP